VARNHHVSLKDRAWDPREVGRLAREKNVALALEALAEVVKQYPRAGLIIVGDGPEKAKLKSKNEKLKTEMNVIFEGWVESDVLPAYYESADMYLLTSNYEGYGRSVMEAHAVGTAILMTDVGVAGYELPASERVTIVAVGDKEKLVEAIMKKIKNQTSKIKM